MLNRVQIREYSSPMIVSLHGNQGPATRSSVFAAQRSGDTRQLQSAQSLLKFGALHSSGQVDHLHGSEISIRSAPRSIYGNDVFLPRQRRQPDSQSAIAPRLQRLPHLSQTPLHRLDIEAALACGAKTKLSILGELLRPKSPVARLQTSTKANLRGGQAMFTHQCKLIVA